MRIVLVGALGKQQRLLAAEFPHLDLRFTNKESRINADSLKAADRILVLTKFISHALYEQLDRSKVVHVPGGMSKLREILGLYGSVSRMSDTIKFTNEEDDDMAAREFNFGIMHTLQPGAHTVFERPNHISKVMFKTRVIAARTRYKSTAGIQTVMEVLANGDKIKVTRFSDPDHLASPGVSGDVPPETAVEDAWKPFGDRPRPRPYTVEVKEDNFARDLWTRSLERNLKHARPVEQAITEANQVLAAYRKHFP